MNIYQFRFIARIVERRGLAIAPRLTLNLRNHPAPPYRQLSRQSPAKRYSACGRKESGQGFVDVLTESERTENGVSPCSKSVLEC